MLFAFSLLRLSRFVFLVSERFSLPVCWITYLSGGDIKADKIRSKKHFHPDRNNSLIFIANRNHILFNKVSRKYIGHFPRRQRKGQHKQFSIFAQRYYLVNLQVKAVDYREANIYDTRRIVECNVGSSLIIMAYLSFLLGYPLLHNLNLCL